MSSDVTKGEFADSIGELLRSKREAKKLSLNDINRDTKMSVKVLKALEQEDFGSFESEIYLKGFLKNYAKFLGLDAEYVLRMLEGQRGGATASRGTMWDIEQSIKEEKLSSPRLLARLVIPLLLIIIIVLSILLALEHRKVKELQSNIRRIGRTTESIEQRPV